MSDTANANGAPEVGTFEVTVNGITFNVTKNVVKKGTAQGTIKYRPDFNTKSLQDFVKAWGEEAVLGEVRSRWQAVSNGISDEAIEDAGGDVEKFKSVYADMFSKFSARGESVKALTERRNELLERFAELASDQTSPDFISTMTELAKVQKALSEKKHKDAEEKAPAVAA